MQVLGANTCGIKSTGFAIRCSKGELGAHGWYLSLQCTIRAAVRPHNAAADFVDPD